MMLAVILATLLTIPLLGVVTFVQVLYLESLRLRTRDLIRLLRRFRVEQHGHRALKPLAIAERQAVKVLPHFQAELKKAKAAGANAAASAEFEPLFRRALELVR